MSVGDAKFPFVLSHSTPNKPMATCNCDAKKLRFQINFWKAPFPLCTVIHIVPFLYNSLIEVKFEKVFFSLENILNALAISNQESQNHNSN